MKVSKNNLLIGAAFTLPVLFILGLALFVTLPSYFLFSGYDFVYTGCTNGSSYLIEKESYLQRKYSIIEGKLTVNNISLPTDYNGNPVQCNEKIFLHNTETNQSIQLSESEAKQLALTGAVISPEFLTVEGRYAGSGDYFLFFGSGRGDYGYYLTKGSRQKKMHIVIPQDSYSFRDSFHLIGWTFREPK